MFAALGAVGFAHAQQLQVPTIQSKTAARERAEVLENRWCRYPKGAPKKKTPAQGLLRLQSIDEQEPNDTIPTAQVIPLGTGPGQDVDIDVTGVISNGNDVDLFRFTANKGDILGVAGLGQNQMDPVLVVFNELGEGLIVNDDDGGLGISLPPTTPFPTGLRFTDSAFTWFVPEDGDYLLAVFPFDVSTIGPYTLQIRTRRPFFEAQVAPPSQQILFIDFDGAELVASDIWPFSTTVGQTTLSPLSSFLSGWGLTPADQNAVIDAILQRVEENFDDLRQTALNGDRDTDAIDGHFDVEIRNSRDHADPFGQPFVSRVIVGGTIAEVGIDTIGIAQFIDPGNYSAEDTAVVLLDLLSGPAFDPDSINFVSRDPGFDIVPLIGRVVGNIVAHEAGHFLGCWHTETFNQTICVMDAGGDLGPCAEVGPDNIAGTPDDIDMDFIVDQYDFFEGVAQGDEPTDLRVAFALATGATQIDTTPPALISETPTRGSQIGGLSSVSVILNESVTGMSAGALAINGSPATGLTGSGSGPYVFTGFAMPTTGTVTVVLSGAGVADAGGNVLAGDAWTYQILDTIPPGQQGVVPAPNAVLGSLTKIEFTFNEQVQGVVASGLTVNDSAATAVAGTGAGPYTFTGFDPPGHGAVSVTLAPGAAADTAGNPFAGLTWAYQIQDCNANGIIDSDDVTNGTSNDCNLSEVPDECEDGLLTLDVGGDVTLQPNEQATLGGNPLVSGGSPPFTILWTLQGNPGASTSSEANPTFGPAPVGTYVARVIVTDSIDCRELAFVNITVGDGGGTIGLISLTTDQPCVGACAPNLAPAMIAAAATYFVTRLRRRRHRKP